MENIKNAIIAYDFLTTQFNKLYPKINSVKFEDSNTDLTESRIYINNQPFVYNIVGFISICIGKLTIYFEFE